jgi:hypothetical protein
MRAIAQRPVSAQCRRDISIASAGAVALQPRARSPRHQEMPMTSRPLAVLLALVVVVVLAPPAHALPEALSKTEIACQNATNKALPAYTKARTGCIATCQKKTPGSAECTAPFGGKALTCVQKADAKLAAVLAKKCTSAGNDDDTCPECYEELDGTCAAFSTDVTAKSIALSDDVTNTIFCDDSGSPDGLTKAEAKCQKTVLKAMTAFVSAAAKCGGNCLKAERKAKTDGTCNPAAFLFLNGDTKTVACLAKAFFKLIAAPTKCTETPECQSDVFDLITRVENGLADVGGDVAVCPAQCGDGFTQGNEQCDPPSSTDECPGNGACTAQCTCPL